MLISFIPFVEKRSFFGRVVETVNNLAQGCRMPTDNALLNKYSLVKGAARRARQLQSGAPPLSNSKSMKACRVAQDEIRAGFVTFVLPERLVAPELPATRVESL
jgi:DNA-directed RNA polymerase subunit omega